MIENSLEKYSVGALLYTPALNEGIAKAVVTERFGKQYSLALCLEDTIAPDQVKDAELKVLDTLRVITESFQQANSNFYLPKIFIRVRSTDQALQLYERLGHSAEILTGFIFPKYDTVNADSCNRCMEQLNAHSDRTVYMMPILESEDLVLFHTRSRVLREIKKKIDSVARYVLNIRVGGNDISNVFSVRRHIDETIYDIGPIAQLFGDIVSTFSRDYVLSGPVWEYFNSEDGAWENGLRREIRCDKLNGFIGKTVIHPKQIPVVNSMLRVTKRDYEDARAIASWDPHGLQVGKSYKGERMNEVRTNINWALKTLALAEIYGIETAHNEV